MADSIEEEELRSHRGLDEHNDATSDDGQQRDDIRDPNAIEDYVPWTSQRLGRERHLGTLLAGLPMHRVQLRSSALRLGCESLDVVRFDGDVEEPGLVSAGVCCRGSGEYGV